MAYTMNIRGRRIYLAQMASSEAGDYIVYEWNDGVFIPSDDDNYPDLDYDDEDESADDIYDFEFSADEAEDEGEELFEEDDDALEEDEDDDDDDEDEDEVETAVREDIEAILSDGFIPQGGVSAVITPEYTTCYTQAFYRKK